MAWRIVALIGFVAILAATLYPTPAGAAAAARTPLLCLVCGQNGGTDVILNLILFTPFATGLRLSGWSWGRVTLACASLSFGVELCQYLAVPGRDASLSDLLTNTIGGAAAAAAAPWLHVAIGPGRRVAQRLVFVGVSLWLVFSALTAWLFMPWLGKSLVLSQRSDRSTEPGAYAGSLGSVVLSGKAMSDGWLDSTASAWAHDHLGREALDIRLDMVSQTAPGYGVWVYRLRSGRGLLAINQMGTRLTFEVPRRLALMGLYNPTLRLDDGAPRTAGVPFTVMAGERGRHIWLESAAKGRTRRADLLLAPTMAWGLVVPFNYAFGWEAPLVTLVWVAMLIAPLGFWGAHTGKPTPVLAILAIAIVLGLGVIPWLSHTGPVPLRDWLAAVMGVAAGWAARGPVAYLATRCGSPSASESSSS